MKHIRSLLLLAALLCSVASLRADTAPAPDLSFLPHTVGALEIVAWDGYSYVARDGRTFWSGVATPSVADLAAALATPRTPPAAPVVVPTEVSRRQLFRALLEFNPALTRAAIRAQLTAEADLIEFDEALEFRRDHPLIARLGEMLGITSAQADAIFIRAAQL